MTLLGRVGGGKATLTTPIAGGVLHRLQVMDVLGASARAIPVLFATKLINAVQLVIKESIVAGTLGRQIIAQILPGIFENLLHPAAGDSGDVGPEQSAVIAVALKISVAGKTLSA